MYNAEMVKASTNEKLLEFYTTGSHTKHDWKCDKCDSIYETRIDNFSNGRRCPYCCGGSNKVNDANCASNNPDMVKTTVDIDILNQYREGSGKNNLWWCEFCLDTY